MKRKTFVILYTIVIVFLVQLIVFSQGNNPPSGNQNPPSTTPPTNIPPTTQDSVTSETLEQHNTQEDCWIGYKGKAYDITSWLPNHPGSAAAIAPYCGTSTEFENAFEGQHGSSQVEKLMGEGTYKGDLQ